MQRVLFVCSNGGNENNMCSSFPYYLITGAREKFLRETGKPVIKEQFETIVKWAKEHVSYSDLISPLCTRALSVKDHHIPENLRAEYLKGYDGKMDGFKNCTWILYNDPSYR